MAGAKLKAEIKIRAASRFFQISFSVSLKYLVYLFDIQQVDKTNPRFFTTG
jgi:hypothetical protein